MSFHERDYEVFLILGAPASPGLWELSTWQPFADKLGPIIASARGKATVRTIQYGENGKTISFGRLAWDLKSHQKWAHSAATLKEGKVRFLHTEVWVPSWTVCAREDLAPDFFIDVLNERDLGIDGKKLLFNQRIVCAVASETAAERLLALRGVLQNLAHHLSAPVFAHTSRQWGVSSGDGWFGSAIQDMAISHLFKVDDPHERKLDGSTFTETWKLLS